MRIAWFTPFAAGSAVGAHSVEVAAALARAAEVEIWTADSEPLAKTPLRVVRYAGVAEPGGMDAVFYNVTTELTALPSVAPGIVILHRPLAAAAGLPPPSLGVVTHCADDAPALARSRLEPVAVLEPLPAEAYAAALLSFLARAQRVAPALALLDHVGAELGRMRAAPELGVGDRVAADFGRFLVL